MSEPFSFMHIPDVVEGSRDQGSVIEVRVLRARARAHINVRPHARCVPMYVIHVYASVLVISGQLISRLP